MLTPLDQKREPVMNCAFVPARDAQRVVVEHHAVLARLRQHQAAERGGLLLGPINVLALQDGILGS